MLFEENFEKKALTNVALFDEKQIITYEKLFQKFRELNSFFQENENQLIIILCQNNIETVVCILAGLAHNACIMLLRHDIDKNRLKNIKSKFKSKSTIYFKNRKICFESDERSNSIVSSNVNLLLETSGSTGEPKFVMLSKAALLKNAQQINERLNINSSNKVVLHLDVTYSYGFSLITSFFLAGASLGINDFGFLDRRFWSFHEHHSVNYFAGVPSHYEMMLSMRILSKLPACLKTFTVAGGALSNDVKEKIFSDLDENDKSFFVMYGQTEAGPRMSVLEPSEFLKRPGSVGKALKDSMFFIDCDGKFVTGSEQKGEVVFQGSNIMSGYAKNHKDLLNAKQLTLLHTGDVGWLDHDNYLYIVGRMDRMVKINGRRVDLVGLETLLESNLGTRAACIKVSEGLKIFIESQNNSSLMVQNLLTKETKLTESQVEIIYLPKLPLNTRGKIDYKDLENA